MEKEGLPFCKQCGGTLPGEKPLCEWSEDCRCERIDRMIGRTKAGILSIHADALEQFKGS